MENQPKNNKVENKSPEVTKASGESYLKPAEKAAEIVDITANEELKEIEVVKNIPVIPAVEEIAEQSKTIEYCHTLSDASERLLCIRDILSKSEIN